MKLNGTAAFKGKQLQHTLAEPALPEHLTFELGSAVLESMNLICFCDPEVRFRCGRPNEDPATAEEAEAALRERYLMAAAHEEEADSMDLMLPEGKRRRSPVDYQARRYPNLNPDTNPNPSPHCNP